MNEDLNGTPEQKIPLDEEYKYASCTGCTSTINFNWVDVNEFDFKKQSLWQRFLNLFKRKYEDE